ncbi:MerR family transcriptional regulator [Paucilactobacillus suebicus]|uniref:Transcriptional regulator n=1 Tax=Paucilactobacillus suebicus DSM 5007 = KCTC 3549 TaxID=1423807 RepID=A0A0R1W0X5_9LACO|nr:MerR family transcriptional regulator [Paucilactobacillus suebicus]KRM11183.1 transcriptional regulator [Paucilactobacillus suebicus DSM 5007 = KCTC 3549]
MNTYSIGEVARKMGLTVEAIRYYDHAGLLPFVKRDSGGRRRFTEDNMQLMQMILDLKRAGVSIKEIAYFVSWRMDGDDSLGQRYDFLDQHEKNLEDQIQTLEKSLSYLRFKKWYYKTALEAGTEQIHLMPDSTQVNPKTYKKYQSLINSGKSAKSLGDK